MKSKQGRMRWGGGIAGFFNRLTGRDLRKSFKREPLFLDMLKRGLGSGPVTLVSIGSSDGTESLYALREKKRDIKIHLLEPDPENLKICRQNIGNKPCRSGQVCLHHLAVSNRTDAGRFFRNPDAPNLNSAVPVEGASIEFDVNYVTLDRFFAKNEIRPPVVLSMDIEGHEVEALEGFFEYASKNRGVRILMEVHPGLYSEEHSFKKVLGKYFEAGYRPALIESAGVPVPEKFKERGMVPVRIEKSRALYEDPDPDFVLDVACHEHLNPTGRDGRVSRKVVRSLLLERS